MGDIDMVDVVGTVRFVPVGFARSRIPAVLALSVWLTGCEKPPAPTADEVLQKLSKIQTGPGGKGCRPAPLEVFLQASPYLNQNAKGQSMPVEVRVLLLKDRELYDKTDFETLWQRGEEALATDLVRSAAVTVFPGKLKIYPMKTTREVAYVALVAIFRQPRDRQWQQLFDVREQNRRCATKDTLHTIVHAVLKDYRVKRAETE